MIGSLRRLSSIFVTFCRGAALDMIKIPECVSTLQEKGRLIAAADVAVV